MKKGRGWRERRERDGNTQRGDVEGLER